ncbi:MAG: hypothetical protein RMK62_12380, partial [Armatimonadota bacterium]|nr:hypothetical protein [Armatimonadota bacterium]
GGSGLCGPCYGRRMGSVERCFLRLFDPVQGGGGRREARRRKSESDPSPSPHVTRRRARAAG